MIAYKELIDFNKVENVYNTIKIKTRHKEKLVKFEIFLESNFTYIINMLSSKNYNHNKYNIFLISEPKYRIIMSESMIDKVVNHLVSEYVLTPLIEPKLISTNVATRKNLGTEAGINYFKKYINKLKVNNEKIYVLKIDIKKYFYSIDHEILFNMLESIIEDKDILNLIKNIVSSTNLEYINKRIKYEKDKEIKRINNSKLSLKEKNIKIKEISKIPYYEVGKGLPIGNLTSQIMAIFYLNKVDHYIKEKLHIKCYIRYMDDLVLIHEDREYLQFCLEKIEEEIKKLKLEINSKTKIYEIHNGVNFLGYKFILKGKKLYTLLCPQTKRRIKRRASRHKNDREFLCLLKDNYNGYLHRADSRSFQHNLVKKSKKVKRNCNDIGKQIFYNDC